MEQEEEYLGTNNRTVNGKSVLYMKEQEEEEDLGTYNRTMNGKLLGRDGYATFFSFATTTMRQRSRSRKLQ